MARQTEDECTRALREASELMVLCRHQINLTVSSVGVPESVCAHIGENVAFARATETINQAFVNLELKYGSNGVHTYSTTRETVDRDVHAIAAELFKRRPGARAGQRQKKRRVGGGGGGVQAKKRRSGGSSACKRCNLIHRKCDGARNTDASAEQVKCTRCSDAKLPCVFG